MGCNNTVQDINEMNKNSVGMMIKNPTRTPKLIQLRGTIPAADPATFFYKRDSMGISAAGATPLEDGGLAFTAPVGFTIAAINTWLVTYALVIRCLNQNVTDAAQVSNSLQNQYLNLDGDHAQETAWAPAYDFASNQNQNLINNGQAMVVTNQSFLKFPIVSDPLVPVQVNITFKGITSVPYSQLSDYLEKSGLQANTASGC